MRADRVRATKRVGVVVVPSLPTRALAVATPTAALMAACAILAATNVNALAIPAALARTASAVLDPPSVLLVAAPLVGVILA